MAEDGRMIELRPYQTEAIAAAEAASERGVQKLAIGLPTGTGKTIVFSKLIHDRGHPALILAHRDELLQQAVSKYNQIDPATPVGIVKARLNQGELPVVAASIQSLNAKRLAQIPRDFRTLVIDEGHHAAADSYKRVLEHFSDVPMHAFFSATLERADDKSLAKVIDEVVYHKTIFEMIEAGYLVDIRALAVRIPKFNSGQLKVVRGDFATKEVEDALIAAGAEKVAVKAWQEHGENRKTILFAPGVESAQSFARAFVDAGIPAVSVSGGLDVEERRARLRAFENDDVKVLTNAMLLTEGYDEPSIECVINARPTRSKVLFIQMVGRGTRLYPGKDDLLVMDLVGNEERLDLMSIPRLFGTDPETTKRKGLKQAVREMTPEYMRQAAGLDTSDVELDVRSANVLDRKDVNYLRLKTGEWMLSGVKMPEGLGDLGTLFLRPSQEWWEDRQTWSAVLEPQGRSGSHVVLCSGYDLGLAMGIAEEQVLRNTPKALIAKDAKWRKDPASEKQRATLRKFNVPVPPEMTKGEAADLLSATFATKGRR